MTSLTTNFERIMDDNEYHHSKENMFVAASSWIMPKGSKLQVSGARSRTRDHMYQP